MRTLIVYYSFSGNTKKACEFLRGAMLCRNYQVDLTELELRLEETSFFKQCKSAQAQETPELTNTDFDVSRYDLVIFSSPVWAFTFAPALRTYINKSRGLDNKKVAIFLTCGAAFTSGKALKELEEDLLRKGAIIEFAAYVKGKKTVDSEYLQDVFKPLFASPPEPKIKTQFARGLFTKRK